MGTTIIALKYNQGVVVGADTRTSVSGYVSNRLAQKIDILVSDKIIVSQDHDTKQQSSSSSSSSSHDGNENGRDTHNSCVVCRSGSAADTQWLVGQAKSELESRQRLYQDQDGRPGSRPSVSQVAHFLTYQLRHAPTTLSASLICAGYDGDRGPQIYTITPGGSLISEDVFSVSGSGSTVILGYIDHELSQVSTATTNTNTEHRTEQQAIDMVTRMIRLSIARDGSSGGLIRLVVMNQNGLRELTITPPAPPQVPLKGFAPATTKG